MSTPTPSAMSGSTPIVTNSVVPIAKPPMASATTAATTRPADSIERSASVAVLTETANPAGGRDIPDAPSAEA
jgi:hypothetical protein